jgi:hypothetical protein
LPLGNFARLEWIGTSDPSSSQHFLWSNKTLKMCQQNWRGLASVFPFKRPVRLLGVTLSSLNAEDSGQDRSWSSAFEATVLKTKKPAAGGGAAGFSKRTEQQLGGGVPLFRQTPLGRRSGPSEFEALREEVHRFDEYQDSRSHRTLNRHCCSAAMREMHAEIQGGNLQLRPLGCQTQKRPRHQRA